MKTANRDFCTECRKETEYILKKVIHERMINGKPFQYESMEARCIVCGNEMSIPSLLDYDLEAFDTAYRKKEEIVSTENILDIMKLYDLGKAPISLALGFGEITITRYLDGQIPSKEYSDIIRKALTDPDFMMSKIEENKNKLGPVAYKKSKKAILLLKESLNGISKKMVSTIAYIFSESNEITPLGLQKILYFSQGVNLALYNKPLFNDDCEAWVHGPVYPKVYQLFKEFKYDPIDDNKYVIFELSENTLSLQSKQLIDSVLNSFGIYSGKILEEITHTEEPWKTVRNELNPSVSSNRTISKKDIKTYFAKQNESFDFSNEIGIKKYIHSILSK